MQFFMLLMHWKCLVPDSVQKASGDSLPPHQTESPDATDTTDGFFRHGRAAPGSVVLHEILLVHVFGFLLLLQHPKSLCNIGYDQGLTRSLQGFCRFYECKSKTF